MNARNAKSGVFALVLCAAAGAASASIYTVSSLGDAGAGTLRQAITDANGHAGLDDINFTVAGTITLATALPAITSPVNLNGNTAPGYAGSPVVGINGNGLAVIGLYVTAGDSTITSIGVRNFAGTGIYVGTNGNVTIQGCYVGTNLAGDTASPNTGGGVSLQTTHNTVTQSVISGNGGNGISVGSVSDNAITSCFIGTNAAGTAAIGNTSYGIRTFGPATTIGGSGAGNVISANNRGIGLEGDACLVAGNYVGTNASGTAAVGTQTSGIEVYGSNNAVGGTLAGFRNVVSGNAGVGIFVGASASGNAIQGNYVGTNAAGTAALPNTSIGIRVYGAADTTIGGTVAGARNVISGNGNRGVTIEQAATGTVVQLNYIGTNAAGAAAIPNSGEGIELFSGGCTIGGAGFGNVISGNTNHGLGIDSDGNVVKGNYIGTNATGTAALGNGTTGSGIEFFSGQSNVIGGTLSSERNVVSGNYRGVTLRETAPSNTLIGNYVGTSADGLSAVPNLSTGLWVFGPQTVIGGAGAGAGNVISGNGDYGVWLLQGSSGSKVYGNRIGTRPDGVTPLPNQFGVLVQSTFGSEIGGAAAGQGNIVAGNSYEGIRVTSGTGHKILGNSMFGNPGLGIDLAPADVTPNDPLDDDFGPNLTQNWPLLTSAVVGGASTSVSGSIASSPNTTYRVELFGNTVCHPSGFGEGKTFLGSVDVLTDGLGKGTIATSLGTTTPGPFITATATDPSGSTSEFGPCVATAGVGPGTLQLSASKYVFLESDGNALITVTRSGGFQGTVGVHYATSDDTATSPADYAATSGDLAFGPEDAVKTFHLPIVFDDTGEAQQLLHVTLSSPTGGAALGAQSTATVELIDVGTALPTVFLSDASVVEGDAGTRTATFTVTTTPHSGPFTVTCKTQDGTAAAGTDYVAKTEMLSFSASDTSKTFVVTVNGDTDVEPDEVFFVEISAASGATVSDGEGEGVILKDDGLTGLRGDANHNQAVEVGDVFHLINYLFASGPAPFSACLADANADGLLSVADVFFLINYLFAGGPAPIPPGC